MEDITQEIRADVIINRVNLLRVTVNESAELKIYSMSKLILGIPK